MLTIFDLQAYTTYCPEATQITHNGVTYTITEATTLTITNCPCTVTKAPGGTPGLVTQGPANGTAGGAGGAGAGGAGGAGGPGGVPVTNGPITGAPGATNVPIAPKTSAGAVTGAQSGMGAKPTIATGEGVKLGFSSVAVLAVAAVALL